MQRGRGIGWDASHRDTLLTGEGESDRGAPNRMARKRRQFVGVELQGCGCHGSM